MRTLTLLLLAAALTACGDATADRDPEGSDTTATDDRGLDTADADRPGTVSQDPIVARFLERVQPAVFTRWGACPFECCVYRDWVAEAPVVVRAEPRTGSRATDTIAAGERFEADSGFVRITGAQLVIVESPVEAWVHEGGARTGAGRADTLVAGDTLLVLEHLGEGHVMLTHGDDFVSAEQFWATEGWTPFGGARASSRGTYGSEWWAQVTRSNGSKGWIDVRGAELANVDACGG